MLETVAVIVGAGVYLLPSIIAIGRGKLSGGPGVVLVNLLLGWTVVGWLLAFVWAFTGRTKADVRLEEQRHRELVAVATGKAPS